MSVISWIRDLFGIQKDMYDTKKTRLEIEKIEDEKRGKFIALATMDDVKKYDANYQKTVQASIKELRDSQTDICLLNLRSGVTKGWVDAEARRKRRRRIALLLCALVLTLLMTFLVFRYFR